MGIPIGIAYSPKTTLAAALGSAGDTCEVADISVFPDPPHEKKGVIVLCADERFASDDPDDYETCYYTSKDENSLTGLERGIEGSTPAEWPVGTVCACLFTNAAWQESMDFIEDVDGNVTTHLEQPEIHQPVFIDAEPAIEEYEEGDVVLIPFEQGEDATDGSWIRFPNGIQICWTRLSTSFHNSGALTALWVFPQEFASTPQVSATIMLTGASITPQGKEVHAQTLSPSATQAAIQARTTGADFEDGDYCEVDAIAIGRWE